MTASVCSGEVDIVSLNEFDSTDVYTNSLLDFVVQLPHLRESSVLPCQSCSFFRVCFPSGALGAQVTFVGVNQDL